MFKVFVAHPYKSIPIEDYRSALKEVEKENPGCKFTYADEEITSDYILEKIEKMILESDISLYDLTTWNPNVALELGLAFGLKRKYYILFNPKQDASEVPSDIRGIERVEYGSMTELRSKVTLIIRKHMIMAKTDVKNEYSSLKEKIKSHILSKGPVSIAQLESALGLAKPMISPFLAELKESREIETIGAKKGTKYQKPTETQG